MPHISLRTGIGFLGLDCLPGTDRICSVAGACGTVHSDNDFIVAIDQDRYGDSGETSQYCGKTVTITGLGKTMQATVADDCPTCDNENSLDMSVALFQSFTSLDVGEFDISWSFD